MSNMNRRQQLRVIYQDRHSLNAKQFSRFIIKRRKEAWKIIRQAQHRWPDETQMPPKRLSEITRLIYLYGTEHEFKTDRKERRKESRKNKMNNNQINKPEGES